MDPPGRGRGAGSPLCAGMRVVRSAARAANRRRGVRGLLALHNPPHAPVVRDLWGSVANVAPDERTLGTLRAVPPTATNDHAGACGWRLRRHLAIDHPRVQVRWPPIARATVGDHDARARQRGVGGRRLRGAGSIAPRAPPVAGLQPGRRPRSPHGPSLCFGSAARPRDCGSSWSSGKPPARQRAGRVCDPPTGLHASGHGGRADRRREHHRRHA